MSDWLEVLRKECNASSQSKVADQLRQGDGFPSKALINQALSDKYARAQGINRLQKLVEARYMSEPEPVDDEEWIAALRAECSKTSQAKVAKDLQARGDTFPSPTIINQALSGKYPGKKGLDRLRDLVRGQYMGVTVDCPMLNEIGLHKCAWWQVQPYHAGAPVRRQMHRACRNCPNRRAEQ